MKWIKIENKLPEDNEDCLITVKAGTDVGGYGNLENAVYSAIYCAPLGQMDCLPYNHFLPLDYEDVIIKIDDVLAWMPYPQPYQ